MMMLDEGEEERIDGMEKKEKTNLLSSDSPAGDDSSSASFRILMFRISNIKISQTDRQRLILQLILPLFVRSIFLRLIFYPPLDDPE